MINGFSTPSEHVKKVLRALKERHNVLISGAPATGKSRLLSEIKYWFCQPPTPIFRANGDSPFPADEHGGDIRDWLPSPDRLNRKVYSITFHQGTKYRDFVSGLMLDPTGSDAKFKVTFGPLYAAAQHAGLDDGAALVIIDEINRGPAVAIFGDTINAIETDKRRLPDGSIGRMTWTFPALLEDGKSSDLSLPHHLYIVAAMNQADTSVEPLDVAFLRRFEPYDLVPDEPLLRTLLSLPAQNTDPLPEIPSLAVDIYEALLRAWKQINDTIGLARGDEFQIGHGIFIDSDPPFFPGDIIGASKIAVRVWSRLFAHVSEVFFGDTRGFAAAIKAGEPGNLFSLENIDFADSSITRINKLHSINFENIYGHLKSIAG